MVDLSGVIDFCAKKRNLKNVVAFPEQSTEVDLVS